MNLGAPVAAPSSTIRVDADGWARPVASGRGIPLLAAGASRTHELIITVRETAQSTS